jgi:hypothetical protein
MPDDARMKIDFELHYQLAHGDLRACAGDRFQRRRSSNKPNPS